MNSADGKINKSRNNFQLPRRVFHMVMGSGIAVLYLFYMDKAELISLLGIAACIIFIAEQIRLKYPELTSFFSTIQSLFYRAEERFEIASAMPYAASCLLIIVAFPRSIAILAVLFLALGDPLAAIIGIQYGKHKIGKNRTLEGSFAFFAIAFLICYLGMIRFYDDSNRVLIFSILGGLTGAFSDFIETRLDDNITIPFISAPILTILSWVIFKVTI